MTKEIFKFRKPDGSVGTESDIILLTLDQQDTRNTQLEAFYISNIPIERSWRNRELAATDYMLLPDATFEGIPLAGTLRLEEIIQYREYLRAYDLKYMDRPLRPYWYGPTE